MQAACRIALVLVTGSCFVLAAIAGPATLDANELPALRDLVARDKAAATQFDAVRSAADAALADKPKPVERIISAGKLESDPDKVRTTAALKDFDKASALAWAWAVTGDERYALKGREFIAAWARVNRTDGNPINETKLEPLIEAYDLLRGSFDADGRARIDRWLDERAMVVWNDPQVRRENWQSHRLKIVGLIAATTGSESLWVIADKGFKDQIGTNFDASGESVDFKRRDALHYHLYAVQPLLTLACVAQSKGERLFDYQASNGATLRESVEFVEPFATGQKKHMEFAESEVSFDRKRGAAGEKSFAQKPWSPRASIRLFAEAGCLDPTYDKLATQVAGSPRSPYVSWRSVLNAVETSRPRK